MTNEERFSKYIEEHCKNCKNRKEALCEIKIFSLEDIVTTKCVYYEREKIKNDKFSYLRK